jgi:hypothetical protein
LAVKIWARALVATLRPQLLRSEVAVYMVVNTSRPYTNTASQIVRQARALAAAAGMPLDGLVQNTNLLEFSEPQLLEAADAVHLIRPPPCSVSRSYSSASLAQSVPQSWLQSDRPVLLLRRFINYLDKN